MTKPLNHFLNLTIIISTFNLLKSGLSLTLGLTHPTFSINVLQITELNFICKSVKHFIKGHFVKANILKQEYPVLFLP